MLGRLTLALCVPVLFCACQSYLKGRADLVFFTCHGAVDRNGDGLVQPDEFDGLGKVKFKSGETVYFGVHVPGSREGQSVYALLRAPTGREWDQGRLGVVGKTVNTFGFGAPVDDFLAQGGAGVWTVQWGLDGKLVQVVTVTLSR